MNEIKAAVVGLGLGRYHLELYNEDPRIGAIALCDSNNEVLDKARDSHPKVRATYASLEKMLSEFRPDIVSVVTPDRFHRDHSTLCLEAGCHVLQTKPLATNLADGQAIVAAAAKARGKFMVAHERRFRRYYSRIKELLDSGTLGDVIHIRVESIQDKRWQIERSPWYGSPDSGRTAVTGSGVHEVDLVRWLGGNRVQEVFAFGNNIGEMSFYAPTTVTSLFHFENGIVGDFTISYQAHWPDRTRRINEGFSLIATKGLIYGKQYTYDGHETWESLPHATDEVREGSRGAIASFLTSVETGTDVAVSAEEALESLKIAVSLNESVETGQKVVLK